jgi:hypothetical protein
MGEKFMNKIVLLLIFFTQICFGSTIKDSDSHYYININKLKNDRVEFLFCHELRPISECELLNTEKKSFTYNELLSLSKKLSNRKNLQYAIAIVGGIVGLPVSVLTLVVAISNSVLWGAVVAVVGSYGSIAIPTKILTLKPHVKAKLNPKRTGVKSKSVKLALSSIESIEDIKGFGFNSIFDYKEFLEEALNSKLLN